MRQDRVKNGRQNVKVQKARIKDKEETNDITINIDELCTSSVQQLVRCVRYLVGEFL